MTNVFRKEIQGFAAIGLQSEQLELLVVPELGAKIVSLMSRCSGREWLWHPQDELHLFHNDWSDPFQDSPLAGIDECLPSIAPFSSIPDHGEVWRVPWAVDEQALEAKRLRTWVRLKQSPFHFVRSIHLAGESVELRYRLTNLSDAPEAYLWAFHPLLRIVEGDRIELPAEIGHVAIESSTFKDTRRGDRWNWPSPQPGIRLDRMDLGSGDGYVKCFAFPFRSGRAAIQNDVSGDRLSFDFDAKELTALGIWITRGGWNGYHHVALEPTNAPADSLGIATADRSCPILAPHTTASWSVRLSVRSVIA